MASGAQWDGDGVPLKDSNCALIGSEEDKASRKKAAQAEPAWADAGRRAGLEVWRVEEFLVKPWPKKKYGSFHKGDSYIALNTIKDPNSGTLSHQIHFWLGQDTSTDEMGTAAYKAVELDDYFDGEPTQHREVMGSESQQFRKLFPKLVYLAGGVDSGFRKSSQNVYESRLLHVRKTRDGGMRCTEVHLHRDSLNQGDCFVLDAGLRIYVWEGGQSSPFEKHKANELAEHIETERQGHAKVQHDLDAHFWELLGGEGAITSASQVTDAVAQHPPVHDTVLFCASDANGALNMTEVARGKVSLSMLKSEDVMLLDTNGEVFIWVGRGASTAEGRSAMRLAMDFLHFNNRPVATPIHMFKEGQSIHNSHWNSVIGGSGSRGASPGASPSGGSGGVGSGGGGLKCLALCCGG